MTKRHDGQALIAALIADLSDEQFYVGMTHLRASTQQSKEALRLCITALNEAQLAQRQIALRVTAVVAAIRPSQSDILDLAALPLGLAIRNVLTAELSPHLRSMFRKDDDQRSPAPKDKQLPPREEIADRLGIVMPPDDAPVSRTVIILTLAQKDAARNLLQNRNYRPLLISEIARYVAELESNADICAVLIDGSFLGVLADTAQREVFERVARYSCFVWVRVEGAGLRLPVSEVRSLLRGERCQSRPVASHDLSIQSGPLAGSELDDLERAAAILQQHEHASFFPGELSSMERRVLVAAAHEWQERTNVNGAITVDRVETRFLQGGYRKVRVASILINGARRPIIAKFSSKERLVDEMKRFRRYVQPIDNQLDPILGYHGDAAVLFVTLVQSEQHADEPAETLEEVLGTFREASWANDDPAQADLLFHTIRSAGYKLLQLNKQHAEGQPHGCPVYLDSIETAEAKGMTWGIKGGTPASRAAASRRFEQLAAVAVMHNDLHLRNILVRGTDAHLIDYEGCGAGHPAVDLVRLEIALFSMFIFPLAPEPVHTRMQERINDPTLAFDTFAEEFDVPSQPAINRLLLRSIFCTRDFAIQAVTAHGGIDDDYLAAKYLVGWQNLLLDGKQVSLSRSIVAAIAPHFN